MDKHNPLPDSTAGDQKYSPAYDTEYNKVLDLIEHPDNYTSEQISDILSDPEAREIYDLLCMADSAMEANKPVDVDAEWEEFHSKKPVRRRRVFGWFGNRAASIAAIVGTSIVAVAAGIAFTVAVSDNKPKPALTSGNVAESVPAPLASDTIIVQSDSISSDKVTIMFEDEPLDVIMKKIAETYNVSVKFNNKDAAALHLYYKLDAALPLDEIIAQLNTFEQINLRLKDNTLIID